MIAPLTFLRTFIVCLATALLIGCDSGGSSKKTTPEINSFNIYTADQIIYSYNEDTRLSTKRGEFDAGDQQFVELNTDEQKQGFEYAVYAYNNGIYLLDYDKDNNAKVHKLTQYASSKVICRIVPAKKTSRAAYVDGKASNRSTLDDTYVTIEIQATGESCDPAYNLRDKLDFYPLIDDDTNTRDTLKTAGASEMVLGGVVTNYSSGGSSLVFNDDENKQRGSTGFIGYDLTGNKIVFNYRVDENKDKWSTGLVSVPGLVPFSKQVSSTQVLVQNAEDLYVLNADNMFTINTAETDVPVQAKIDNLFSAVFETLPDTTTVETNRSQNDNTFLIKQNNSLYYFEGESFTAIPVNQIQDETKLDFDLTSNNLALVVQENPDSSQTLIAISTDSGEASTILTAEKVELQVIGSEFYINTLNLESNSGWQAHWFKTQNSPVTYSQSRFVFAEDLRSTTNTLLLLSSDEASVNDMLIKPALYIFDKTQASGRKKGLNKDKERVDFSLGKLNTDVATIQASVIINDKFGRILLTGVYDDGDAGRAVEEHYFFDPTKSTSSQNLEKQSLKLMARKVL